MVQQGWKSHSQQLQQRSVTDNSSILREVRRTQTRTPLHLQGRRSQPSAWYAGCRNEFSPMRILSQAPFLCRLLHPCRRSSHSYTSQKLPSSPQGRLSHPLYLPLSPLVHRASSVMRLSVSHILPVHQRHQLGLLPFPSQHLPPALQEWQGFQWTRSSFHRSRQTRSGEPCLDPRYIQGPAVQVQGEAYCLCRTWSEPQLPASSNQLHLHHP